MGNDLMMNDVNDQWHQYRTVMGTPSRRRLFCGVVWIICVLSLILIAFTVMSVRGNTLSRNVVKADADTEDSIFQLYDSFPSSLNASLDPCVDFYNFTCSSWVENNPVPPYETQVTTFSILQETEIQKKRAILENTVASNKLPRVVNDAVNFYKACMAQSDANHDSVKILSYHLNKIGGWPAMNREKWNETLFDWYNASAYLIRHLDVHTVIGVYTIDDSKEGCRNLVYLKSPTVLDDIEHVLSNMASQEMLYVILSMLNPDNLSVNVTDDIDSVTVAETKWRKLLSLPKQLYDPLYMTIKELSEKIPDMDWLNYLQLVTNDTLNELNAPLTLNDTVVVQNLEFLEKVISILNSGEFSKIELANLFGWFVTKDMWILIPEVLENYAKINEYSASDIKTAASNQCYELVQETFPQSLDYLYVKNSPREVIQNSRILADYLKSAFKNIIHKSVWLDNHSKVTALLKLTRLEHIIGFPDYLSNKTKFDEAIKNFPSMGNSTLQYLINIQQYLIRKRFTYTRVPTCNQSWILPRPLSDVSAYFIVSKNTVVYPISLHYPPFYYFNGPWYLNFGAAGSIIGHEMMHGFDNYNGDGSDLLNSTWLSKKSRKSYQKLGECFKYQYNDHDSSGEYINNGTWTVRENIADNEGLHVAYEAYKKHSKDYGGEERYQTLKTFTPDQMFFIAYASVWCSKINPSLLKSIQRGSHSFPDLRVNMAVSNSEYFAKAFNCPAESPMNPVKKCSIW